MRLFRWGALLAVLCAPVGVRAADYGMAGCGLGSLIIADDPGFIQVFAATSNFWFGTQTFGIVSGTSNCTGAAGIAALDQALFMRTNFANVMRDAAAGEGEYLSTLATLLGCEESANPAFGALTQREYARLFGDGDHHQTLIRIKAAASHSGVLANACSRI